MKKDKRKYKPQDENPSTEGPEDIAAPIDDGEDENPIQNFIELKKLQNRILEKMIENINQKENKNKSKKK